MTGWLARRTEPVERTHGRELTDAEVTEVTKAAAADCVCPPHACVVGCRHCLLLPSDAPCPNAEPEGILCPECAQGKCVNCTGDVLTDDDTLEPCAHRADKVHP